MVSTKIVTCMKLLWSNLVESSTFICTRNFGHEPRALTLEVLITSIIMTIIPIVVAIIAITVGILLLLLIF